MIGAVAGRQRNKKRPMEAIGRGADMRCCSGCSRNCNPRR